MKNILVGVGQIYLGRGTYDLSRLSLSPES